MTQRQNLAPPDAGVSLIEALASLVIVGMIALMITGGAFTGRRVWEGLDSREATGEAIDSAQTTLRDRLEQTFPATLFDQTPPYPDFEGSASGLVFLSSPPDAARPAPVRRYTIGVDASGGLMLSSIAEVGPAETAKVSRETLLRGVRALEVAYFGPQPPDGGRRWGRIWHAQPALPEAVRLRITFAPEDRRQWPDLIVRPRATVDVACSLSPVNHRCKGRT